MSRPARSGMPIAVDVVVADDAREGEREAAALVRHALRGRAPGAVAAERQGVGDASALDAGNLVHAAQHLVVGRAPLLFVLEAAVRIDADGRRPLGHEAHVHFDDAQEAPHEQAGADDEHARERDLGNDQPVADPGAPSSLGGSARGFPQRGRERRAAALERGRETEHDAGRDRDPERERQRRDVRAHLAEQGDADRLEPGERTRARDGQHEPDDGPAAREHDAIGQHLRDEPPSPGSERGADRDFLLARRGPREQQVRQVRAHDQHYQTDGAGEHPHGEPDTSTDLIAQRLHVPLETVAAAGVLRGQLRGNRSDLGVRRLRSDVGLQPPDHRHRVPETVSLLTQREREVEIELAAWREHGAEVERCREDADDGVRLVVDGQRRADDGGIGVEAPFPEPCASMTAFGPFQVHSSAVNVRPSAGRTPRTSKKLSDTGTPLSRSGSPFPLSRLSPTPWNAKNPATAESDRVRSRRLSMWPTWVVCPERPAVSRLAIQTSRSGSAKGSGRRISVWTTLKTVTLAPMPNPAMRIANVAKPASRRRTRMV